MHREKISTRSKKWVDMPYEYNSAVLVISAFLSRPVSHSVSLAPSRAVANGEWAGRIFEGVFESLGRELQKDPKVAGRIRGGVYM